MQTCSLCGKALLGRYWRTALGGKEYVLCEPCRERTSFCNQCGEPIRGEVWRKGKIKLCQRCLAERPRCLLCGKPVLGRYVQYRSERGLLTVCNGCFRSHPQCAVCGLPFREGGRVGDREVCARCLAEAPRCHACKAPIVDTIYSFESSGHVFCAACKERRPTCDACGEPLGDTYDLLSDGRSLCLSCSATAVTSPREAERLFAETRQRLERLLGMRLEAGLRFRFVDRPTLLARARELPDLRGETKTRGLFIQEGDRREILVMAGLPLQQTAGVMAHELAHAWQAEHCPGETSRLLREGFAEWVTYRVLLARGADKEAANLLRREDLYGRGFKRMLQIEKRSGKAAVFAEICGAP